MMNVCCLVVVSKSNMYSYGSHFFCNNLLIHPLSGGVASIDVMEAAGGLLPHFSSFAVP